VIVTEIIVILILKLPAARGLKRPAFFEHEDEDEEEDFYRPPRLTAADTGPQPAALCACTVTE